MDVSQASPTSDPPPRGKGGEKSGPIVMVGTREKSKTTGFQARRGKRPKFQHQPRQRATATGDPEPWRYYSLPSVSGALRSLGGLMRPLNRLSAADADGFYFYSYFNLFNMFVLTRLHSIYEIILPSASIL